MPNLDIGLHLGAGEYSHMGFGSDMLLDPRMDLPLFGIKNEMDNFESPGPFPLTPRMFDTFHDHQSESGQPMHCMGGGLPSLDFGDGSMQAAALMHPASEPTPPPSNTTITSPAAQTCEQGSEVLPAPFSTASTTARDRRRRRSTVTTASAAAPTATTKSGPATAAKASASTGKFAASRTRSKRSTCKEAREEARRNRCLERNRIAASKCREKKKAWMHDLEATKTELESQHASLQREFNGLLEEATQIKTSLMAHAGCNDQNIDMWIENEAIRFVRRANRMPRDSIPGNTRHSSIASLASLQSQNESVALSSAALSDDTQLSSPGLDCESTQYDMFAEDE
ncbi:hypothetical protein HIM_10357 [Hirsutella minnesotensis 3608]|uniref:BZIP domain-containing protein n=1 Tax=Hirsutella minnesotensis 3608 TaxID=1043627 RepID=A0A0F7ZRU9_9HYPO|nr:hypothetical protein HIM_10357 [Hirsutella minnesotensis 3608]